MIQRRDIKKWCEIVAQEFRPEQIIVFGSYAGGTPTEDSDVDVLVVMPLARGHRDVRQAQRFGSACLLPFRWMSLCVRLNKLRDDSRLAMALLPASCVTAKRCMKASTREWI